MEACNYSAYDIDQVWRHQDMLEKIFDSPEKVNHPMIKNQIFTLQNEINEILKMAPHDVDIQSFLKKNPDWKAK